MAPVPIEDDIKAELGEVVSQAMLVGIFFSKTCFDQLLDLKKCFYQLLDLRKKTIGSAQVGDQRKHLAVLLTLRTELDEKGQPTDNLHPEVKNYKGLAQI